MNVKIEKINKMKRLNRITTLFVAMLSMYFLTSCGDNESWAPGPQPAANNPGVYFDKDIPTIIEMEADQQGKLIDNTVTLRMGRDESKSGEALQVPIKVRYNDANLTIGQTATFEAGASTTELKISIGDFKFKEQYYFSIEVDENYSNPYKVYAKGENGGSTRLEANIEVVCLLGTATFTPVDYSSSTPPQFVPFEQKIYDNKDSTYTIKNFLYNNAGYKFSFAIDNDKNIRPLKSSGYHSDSDQRWYFYSENKNDESVQIPCYIPGTNPNDYVTYIYFYTPENTSRYTAFWMDLSTKTGRMMGFARYSVSSLGRIAFDFTWE